MKRIALSLALALSLGCGGSRTVGDGSGSKAQGPAPTSEAPTASEVTAVLHITLEFEVSSATPPTSQITLVETNETGSNTRHMLGEFDGECKDATVDIRRGDPEVFLGFHCQPFGEQRGVLVHILKRRGQLVLLRAWLGTSKPNFDDFDQIGELPPTPSGVPLVSDFD